MANPDGPTSTVLTSSTDGVATPSTPSVGLVRVRRETGGDIAGGGALEGAPPATVGTVPTGPSGTPIVTLGGGIEGKPAPATPAPGGNVTGRPPAANPVVEKQPEVQGPTAEVMGPPDWWDAMPVSSRDDLIRQIETLQFNTGQLENALAAERNARQELEGRLANLPQPGEPKLDALVANPPWATPNQIPPIPPIPPDFRNTSEYGSLVARNVGQDNDIARISRSLDNVALGVGNAQADIGAFRRTLEGIAANPTFVSVEPSAQRISDQIASWFSVAGNREQIRGPRGPQGLPGTNGKDGRDGAPVPAAQIDTAIADYFTKYPPTTPLNGKDGKDGKDGVDGRTPTPDEVRGVVEQVLSGVSDLVRDPTAYIWDVILKGVRERFQALFDAVLGE